MRTKRLDSGQDHFPILRVTGPVRRLVLVLGDQLDPEANALTQFDRARDAIPCHIQPLLHAGLERGVHPAWILSDVQGDGAARDGAAIRRGTWRLL